MRGNIGWWIWFGISMVFFVGYVISPTTEEVVGFFGSAIMGRLTDFDRPRQ